MSITLPAGRQGLKIFYILYWFEEGRNTTNNEG